LIIGIDKTVTNTWNLFLLQKSYLVPRIYGMQVIETQKQKALEFILNKIHSFAAQNTSYT